MPAKDTTPDLQRLIRTLSMLEAEVEQVKADLRPHEVEVSRLTGHDFTVTERWLAPTSPRPVAAELGTYEVFDPALRTRADDEVRIKPEA